jgi:predicted aspartyl protease
MSLRFRANQGLFVIPVEMFGPAGPAILRCALDTGATSTLVNTAMVVALGYDPASSTDEIEITTGSGVEIAPRVIIDRVSALGSVREGFPILSHTLPPNAGIDGLLGLDFLRGRKLVIDFGEGEIDLV